MTKCDNCVSAVTAQNDASQKNNYANIFAMIYLVYEKKPCSDAKTTHAIGTYVPIHNQLHINYRTSYEDRRS